MWMGEGEEGRRALRKCLFKEQISLTCCHTAIEFADQISPQHTEVGPVSSSTDPITTDVQQCCHLSSNFQVACITGPCTNNDNYNNCNNNNNRIQGRNSRFLLLLFFYNLLTAPRTISNTYPQVNRVKSCANHVQHIERLSRATCRVTRHVV